MGTMSNVIQFPRAWTLPNHWTGRNHYFFDNLIGTERKCRKEAIAAGGAMIYCDRFAPGEGPEVRSLDLARESFASLKPKAKRE